jgi:multiple sugar transport system ATP-binding protein
VGELRLQGLHKAYAGAASTLSDVNLKVSDGELMVLVGPSGCGKSTLLRVIAGLEPASAGAVFIGGEDVTELAPAERGVAMVFQSYALYPHMTVAENMGFALRMAGAPREEERQAVQTVAELLQLDTLLDRKPKALSGGQRQRVAIGRAIVRRPKVFLFDEPLSNLDAALRAQTRLELARLHRELKITTVYVTHDQVEAMTLGQRIALLNGGRIEQVGVPLELFERPRNRFVAEFLGTPRMNFVAEAVLRTAAAQRAWCGDAGVPTGGWLGVRPEHLLIVPEGQGLPATVLGVEHLGDTVLVHVRWAAASPGAAEAGAALRLQPQQGLPLSGSTIELAPRPGHALLFDAAGNAVSAVSTTGDAA